MRRRNQRADGPGAVDALIMTLGLSLISGILLIAPYIHDRTLTLLPKLVSIGYPMGDIILLAAGSGSPSTPASGARRSIC